MAPAVSADLQFVVSTGLDRPNPRVRKLIRSHVMLGRNLGSRSARSGVPRIEPSRKLHNTSPGGSPEDKSSSTGSETSPTADRPISTVAVPRRFAPYASTFRLADETEPAAVEVILKFSTISKQVLFALEKCIFFDKRAEGWIAPLAIDPALLHFTIFTSQYYYDVMLSRPQSPAKSRVSPHYLKSIRLLRDRLARGDDSEKLSSTTVTVVMGLAGFAMIEGDLATARHHIQGLSRIISLRGGTVTLRPYCKLLVEILRCDLGMALETDFTPVFFSNRMPQEAIPLYPDLRPLLDLRTPEQTMARQNLVLLPSTIDGELTQAWDFMSSFCEVINFAAHSDQCVTTEVFLDTMSSVMYRLLAMHFDSGSADEAIRLGLLSFSCSAFLQWRSLGGLYLYSTPVRTTGSSRC
ncbi:hypothetical protein DL768_010836 [Monosporascus sp. mg162]|nr:hypothetical protein DL768_010836 [Monosporascus sp. mg162]